ncbi:transglutaminase-like domain-containing protein [Psychroserpens ponticola]|uniref:Transglutaminase-like domain-containing protein n=1 Tax=Psychroserpens ponticola TaxID=2932268 RepID=A0ABY7RZP0_9FLAO|nr:transglutaminase-like domain-containing protein [Psychroserpens ponticola]WCO02547.1 transglutaminase-like domain-containing protein [Psychroserpens ponticola]
MILKKILWTLKRHPFLYLTRFRLLSKNSNINEIMGYSYNIINDKKDIPNYFTKINDTIFKNDEQISDFDLVKKLGNWLVDNVNGGPGLSVPSEDALKIMLAGKGGVCSDMVQIFNNFCVINDIKVREWGVTRAPFNTDYGGHSFNEVYIKELNKWIMIDVSYCALFYLDGDTPLSVTEFYKLLREGKKVSYKIFNTSIAVEHESIDKNYLNPDNVPFLICNYSNKVYDSFLKTFRPLIPIFIIHFFLFIIGKSYNYKFPLDNYKNIFS